MLLGETLATAPPKISKPFPPHGSYTRFKKTGYFYDRAEHGQTGF